MATLSRFPFPTCRYWYSVTHRPVVSIVSTSRSNSGRGTRPGPCHSESSSVCGSPSRAASAAAIVVLPAPELPATSTRETPGGRAADPVTGRPPPGSGSR
jgi:hypothetical protein